MWLMGRLDSFKWIIQLWASGTKAPTCLWNLSSIFECLIFMNSCWHRFLQVFYFFCFYSNSHVTYKSRKKTAMVITTLLWKYIVTMCMQFEVLFSFLILKNRNGPWTLKTVLNDIARLNSVAFNNNNKCCKYIYEFRNISDAFIPSAIDALEKLPANYTKNDILIGF